MHSVGLFLQAHNWIQGIPLRINGSGKTSAGTEAEKKNLQTPKQRLLPWPTNTADVQNHSFETTFAQKNERNTKSGESGGVHGPESSAHP